MQACGVGSGVTPAGGADRAAAARPGVPPRRSTSRAPARSPTGVVLPGVDDAAPILFLTHRLGDCRDTAETAISSPLVTNLRFITYRCDHSRFDPHRRRAMSVGVGAPTSRRRGCDLRQRQQLVQREVIPQRPSEITSGAGSRGMSAQFYIVPRPSPTLPSERLGKFLKHKPRPWRGRGSAVLTSRCTARTWSASKGVRPLLSRRR